MELTPKTSQAELLQVASNHRINVAEDDSWNDLFFRIFMEKIEPQLGQSGPVVLKNWPASQASLARVQDGWAQRFEIYWQGKELANAYLEENNPEKNRKIFTEQNQLRAKQGKEVAPLDESFFSILQGGMPPAVGIALGLDRLFAIAMGQENLQQVRPFPE